MHRSTIRACYLCPGGERVSGIKKARPIPPVSFSTMTILPLARARPRQRLRRGSMKALRADGIVPGPMLHPRSWRPAEPIIRAASSKELSAVGGTRRMR